MLEEYNTVLNVDEVCKILHIGKNTAYRMLRNNEIPSKKIKRKYIIPKLSIEKFLKNVSKTA